MTGETITLSLSPFKPLKTSKTNGHGITLNDEIIKIREKYNMYADQCIPDDGFVSEAGQTIQSVIDAIDEISVVSNTNSPIPSSGATPPPRMPSDIQRAEVLSKIDRYGFFLDDSSDIQNNGSMLSIRRRRAFPIGRKREDRSSNRKFTNLIKRKRIINHTMSIQVNTDTSIPADDIEKPQILQIPQIAKMETKRERKWSKMARKITNVNDDQISNPIYEFRPHRKLRKRVYKGIPESWRSAAWCSFITSTKNDEIKSKSFQELSELYPKLLEDEGGYDSQIDLDVPRTISGHIMFRTRYGRGQQALFNILRAFSIYDRECGYCQGMGCVVTTLLLYYTEVAAFAMLVWLFEFRFLRQVYLIGFPALHEVFYVQGYLAKKFIPRLEKKMQDLEINSSCYATKWYIALYNDVVPFSTQLRIWDILMYHRDPDSFYTICPAVAITILSLHQTTFLHSDISYETVISTLTGFQDVLNDDEFIKHVGKIINRSIRHGWIRKARQEWNVKKENGEILGVIN